MPTRIAGEWLLVEILGDRPRVVAEGSRKRDWRPLTNVARGRALKAIEGVVASCCADRAAISRRFDHIPGLGDAAVAIPVVGPSGEVYAVHVWFGSNGDVTPAPNAVGAFEWEIKDDGWPPRLWLGESTPDLLGIDHEFRDRAAYGPADLYTRMPRLSDIVSVIDTVRSVTEDRPVPEGGECGDLSIVLRGDDDVVRSVQYVYRRVDTPAGRRLKGVFHDTSAGCDPTLPPATLADSELARVVFVHNRVHGAIVDIQTPKVPYIVKWMAGHVPGIGHGVSTGQTPGIHPDDRAAVMAMCLRARTGSASGTVRVRRAGGGWIPVAVTASIIDPAIDEHLVLAMISAPTQEPGHDTAANDRARDGNEAPNDATSAARREEAHT